MKLQQYELQQYLTVLYKPALYNRNPNIDLRNSTNETLLYNYISLILFTKMADSLLLVES